MKQMIERTNTSTKRFSTRTVAMVLSIVMLIGSIATGSMLSTFAAYLDNAAQADAVTQAAAQGGDIALNAIPSEDAESKAVFSDSDENDIVRRMKSDLAVTGANTDLAETGYTNCYVYTSSSKDGNYTQATSFSGNAGSFNLTLTDNQTIYFYIQGDSNSNYFGGDWTLPYNQTYNMGQYYNTTDLKKITFTATNGAGTYTFTVTDVSSGGGTIKATGGNGSSGGGTTTTSKVYFKNNVSWTNVYAYFYKSGGYWDDNNGSGSATGGNFISKVQMDYNSTYGVFEANIPNEGVIVCFLKDSQDGYGNFYNTQGSYQTIDTSNPLFTPNTSSYTDLNKANNTYVRYYDGTWGALETTYTVNITAGTGGTVNPSGDQTVGVTSGLSVIASPNQGYEFSGWTKTAVTTSTETATTVVKPTNSNVTHELVANFTKKSYKVNYSSASNGTFTVKKTTGGATVSNDSSVEYGTDITVTCTPNKGYTVSSVQYTNASGNKVNASGTGNTRTFSTPAADTTITVTFTGKSYAISGSASPSVGGSMKVTTSASATQNQTTYSLSADRYLRATANAAYNFDKFVVTYATGETQTITTNDSKLPVSADYITNGDEGSISVVAYFTKKPTHKVTVVSNNNSYGTASASVAEAYDGQQVTLTATENSGTWSKWTVTSGTMATVDNQTTNPLTFTMGNEDLTITANFTAYEAVSDYYYNGYSLSDGNASPYYDYYGQQMTKAKVGGKVYSYYEVSGRTDDNQLLTVSKYSPYYSKDGGIAQTYFQIRSDWYNASVTAQFYASDEKHLGDFSNMTFDKWDNNKNKYYKLIPDGARYVKFKNGSDPTDRYDFADSNHNNGWYTTDGGSTLKDLTGFNDINLVPQGFIEYFNTMADYTADFNTIGFWDHGANRGESHRYSKPKENSGSYYIIVLEPNTSYTFNDVTKTTGSKPMVLCSTELPDSGDTVKVYAKDGAIRPNGSKTYANIADTTVLKADGTTSAGARKVVASGDMTYEIYKAQKGETITIKTTVGNNESGAMTNASTLSGKYYVRGFMINGEVPRGSLITEPKNDGVYTIRYTVPEDYEKKYVEITPVYYLCNTTTYPVVTFRVTGFPKNQHNWGDTPYAYPFYSNLGGYNNSFGQYPGQPLIFYNGQYQVQIPQKSTAWELDTYDGNNKDKTLAQVNDTYVSGITMSNGWFDDVHKLIMGYGDDNFSADHVQTYDYGDFYKIFNEKKPVDNIVFDFKYREKKHNLVDDQTGSDISASTLTDKYGDTNGNGFELLKNYHGRNVDLFGTALSGDAADPTKTPPVYVVSIGGINENASPAYGVENIAGYYATEWRVYAPNSKTSVSTTYKKMSSGGKSSIPPEVLVLNDDDATSFNTSTYPSAVNKSQKSYQITDWKSLYTALEDYRGLPVYISYEAADAQQGEESYVTGTHGATRNDGRWLYSKNGENITSNIKIQYSDDNGTIYKDLDKTSPQVSGLSAYFTNTGVSGTQTYATTIDPDKTFDFEAKTTNGEYKFMGWYMADGTMITPENAGSTERSGSHTFVAKFMKVTTGQLIMSHSVATDDTYKGYGTVTIGAVVKDADGAVVKTYAPSASDITLDDKIIKSDNSHYTVDVTLTATRGESSPFGITTLATPAGQESKFFDYGSYTQSDDEQTRTFQFTFSVGDLFSGTDQTTKNLIYHSYFDHFTFNYGFKFEVPTRDGSTKYYYRNGTLDSQQVKDYVYKVWNESRKMNDRYLRKEFVDLLAPYESNFGKDISWNTDDYVFTGSGNVYTIDTQYVNATQTGDKKVDVTFVLPYAHDAKGVATVDAAGVGTAAASTNYALIKDGDTDNRVTFSKIPKDGNGNWVTAPTQLSDGTFFRYWSVKRTSDNIEVARCYYPSFNYVACDNYEITARYGEPTDITKSGIYTGITYLETSRNQWNSRVFDAKSAAEVPKGDITNAADMLYNDFILNYNYNGVDIYKNGDDAKDITELGMVVERVKELDKNSDNSYDTRISSYTSLTEDTANVTTTAKGTQASQTLDGKKFYKQTVTKTELDNKNRILFFEAFSNSSGWNPTTQKPQANYVSKKYVYRAYTYMTYKENGESKTVLSEQPAYFIMYDIATAQYAYN